MSIPISVRYRSETKEQWITFDHEGIYAVSNLGRIRNNRTGRVRRFFCDKDGYLKIKLYDQAGNRIANRVHVLVAVWHLRPPHPGEEVDHIDGKRDNNAVTNLRWVTHYQNVQAGIIRREKEYKQQYLFEEML